MANIHELGLRRAQAAAYLQALGVLNVPDTLKDYIAAAAAYRLALEASRRAEKEFRDAINAMSTDELAAIAAGQVTDLQEKSK